MINNYNNILGFMFLYGLTVACDPYGNDEYREYVVVEAYLVADQSLPAVHLSTTLPADQEYSFAEAAVSEANVIIQLLTEDQEDTEISFIYRMSVPGVYQPDTEHAVLPGRTYLLEADIPGYGELTARTTVPAAFEILGTIPDTIVYQSSEQLEFTLSSNVNPGRQNVYLFNTIAANPEFDNLTPFYRGILENNDNNSINDFANNSSNLINEGNFTKNPDGSIELRFPWIGVAFFGENQIVTNSLDNNIFDFIRSQDVQLGGSTLSPGEIPNAIYHIEGGIGVFGGVAADTIQTYISRAE